MATSQVKTPNKSQASLIFPLWWKVFVAAAFAVGIFILFSGLDEDDFISMLPMLNALLNLTATCLLATGFMFIKQGNWQIHRIFMLAAFAASILFLLSYVTHLAIKGTTSYEGSDFWRIIYFFILFPHVLLAMTVPFLALVTLYQAWKNPWTRHAKIARITFPIWMYVSVTGVLVYLMLRVFQW